jgi:hypothetical protein
MKARRGSNAVVTRAIPSGRNAGDSESGRISSSELRGTEFLSKSRTFLALEPADAHDAVLAAAERVLIIP